jgi:phospholipase/carboxylesterase
MTVTHLAENKKMRHFHKNQLRHLFIVSLYHNIAHMKKIATLLFSIFIIAAKATAQQATLQEDLTLKYLVQLPTQKSANPPVIILLHGYGSDERDLFELRNFFPKNYIIIAARAPYKLPNNGYQWYEMTEVNGIHDGNPAQLTNSRNQIKKFITQVISKYHSDPKAVYLSGFSQGAIMSYQVGLTAPQMLRGIAVLSGTIYPSLKPLVKKSPSLSELKIFISHGNVDDSIPFTDGHAAYDYLKKLGLNPDFHKYVGMGHSISKDVLFDFVNWLKK